MFTFLEPKRWMKVLAATSVAIVLTACEGERNQYTEPPPPKVTVSQPLQQQVTEFLEFTGTTHAVEEVEIRARVSGFLKSMHFTPGAIVEKGDLLFLIDPREYQAELDAAGAELASAIAELKRAETEYARAVKLFEQKAGAETEVVKWRGERDIFRAAVARAQAKIKKAKLNLSYTTVTAPISGRVSRNLVDIGNLVGEKEPTLLATVTDYDPMYVYFNVSERELLRVMDMFRQRIKEKGINVAEESGRKAEVPLFLGLANQEGYPLSGIVDYSEGSLDAGTGTLQLRGIFENSGNPPLLLPGLFVRLRMPIAIKDDALLVSERAIGADQSGNFLLVANNENVVEKRLIRMGQLVDGLRVIEEGVLPGERVIVKGVQRVRSGAEVETHAIEMKSLTSSAIRAAYKDKREPAAKPETPESKKTNASASEKKPEGN
jgi:RND family efflux transporter MFP subunit